MGGGGQHHRLREAIGGVHRNQHHDLHRDHIAGVDRDRRSGMQRAPSPVGAQRERIGIGGETVVAQEVSVGIGFSRRDGLVVSRREGELGAALVSAQVRPAAPRSWQTIEIGIHGGRRGPVDSRRTGQEMIIAVRRIGKARIAPVSVIGKHDASILHRVGDVVVPEQAVHLNVAIGIHADGVPGDDALVENHVIVRAVPDVDPFGAGVAGDGGVQKVSGVLDRSARPFRRGVVARDERVGEPEAGAA